MNYPYIIQISETSLFLSPLSTECQIYDAAGAWLAQASVRIKRSKSKEPIFNHEEDNSDC